MIRDLYTVCTRIKLLALFLCIGRKIIKMFALIIISVGNYDIGYTNYEAGYISFYIGRETNKLFALIIRMVVLRII